MADFTLTHDGPGWRYTVPTAAGVRRGWRPTQRWAKAAARRRLLEPELPCPACGNHVDPVARLCPACGEWMPLTEANHGTNAEAADPAAGLRARRSRFAAKPTTKPATKPTTKPSPRPAPAAAVSAAARRPRRDLTIRTTAGPAPARPDTRPAPPPLLGGGDVPTFDRVPTRAASAAPSATVTPMAASPLPTRTPTRRAPVEHHDDWSHLPPPPPSRVPSPTTLDDEPLREPDSEAVALPRRPPARPIAAATAATPRPDLPPPPPSAAADDGPRTVDLRSRNVVIAVLAATLVVTAFGGWVLLDGSHRGSGSSASTAATTRATEQPALASAAGKPCVALSDPLPAGAPANDGVVGPPPNKLVTKDLVVGTGATVPDHGTVSVDLLGVACSTGKVFASSYDTGTPVQVPLGQVITGWADGVAGMKVGGQRLIEVPSGLAFGDAGLPPTVAPDEMVWFLVTLQGVTA